MTLTPEQQKARERYHELYLATRTRAIEENERKVTIVIYLVAAGIGLAVSLGVVTAFYLVMRHLCN